MRPIDEPRDNPLFVVFPQVTIRTFGSGVNNLSNELIRTEGIPLYTSIRIAVRVHLATDIHTFDRTVRWNAIGLPIFWRPCRFGFIRKSFWDGSLFLYFFFNHFLDPPRADPHDTAGCRDGVYTAESIVKRLRLQVCHQHDAQGRGHHGGTVRRVNRAGMGKRDDPEYAREMKPAGVTPAEAYPRYEQQLLKSQDIMKMDAVTGATYSLYRFRSVAAKALTEAKRGK